MLLLSAIVGLVPQAQAASVIQATLAGSSGAWQTLGVGTYNYLHCANGAGNCFHWTSASNVVNLTDTRVTPVNVDPGTVWVVWAVSGTNVTKVWSDDKVDTVVGNRCFFAQPQCTVNATSANLAGSGSGQIASSLWGADTALPSTVVGIFTSGTLVNALAPMSVRKMRPLNHAALTPPWAVAAMLALPATGPTASAITQTTSPAFARLRACRRRTMWEHRSRAHIPEAPR